MSLWKPFNKEQNSLVALNNGEGNIRSRQWFKAFLHKSKVTMGFALCSAVLTSGSIAGASSHTLGNQLETIYHVYVNGERVGSIGNKENYEQLINEKIDAVQQQYTNLNLAIGEKVDLIPERVFQSRTKTKETLAELEQMLTVQAEAVALEVNGEKVLYVHENEAAEFVLEKLKLEYVTEEQYNQFLQNSNRDDGIEESKVPEVGVREVQNIRLSAPVNMVEEKTDPEKVLSVEQAVRQLQLGTLEDKKYVVEPGDVLGSIASKHDLKISEILQLNPNITEDTLLQIGQEINVTAYEPIVTVLVEEAVTLKEEIPFQTETREDDTMWKGDTKVGQEGKKGMRIVSYEVTKENGNTIRRELIEEEVLEEAVPRIIIKGTKESPSRGTGNLGWPAVGGYISSYQGTRWGRFHRGIDIARPSNYNILAADNGTVTFAGWNGGYGNTIKIDHNNGIETLYAHLKSIDVSVGDTVGKGQKIGVMGSTGNSTGIHLHFEVYKDGDLENPMDYLK